LRVPHTLAQTGIAGQKKKIFNRNGLKRRKKAKDALESRGEKIRNGRQPRRGALRGLTQCEK